MQSLRGVSLPNEEVLEFLDDKFVLGTRNIEKDEHVGLSRGYKATQSAVGTTNGAGGRNVQIMVLDTDETVIHVLPGYWHPEDLITELEFALQLRELYRDESRSEDAKVAMFEAMHRAHIRRFSDEILGRSRWQHFDAHHEVKRSQTECRDVFVVDEDGQRVGDEVVPVCELVHRRMIDRPFLELDDFDMEEFVDYGRPYYDNNSRHDKRGKRFSKAVKANRERERELEERKRELERFDAHQR